MKVILASFGTEGDLTPFIRVAQALQTNGHQVLFLANPSAMPMMRQRQICARAVGEAFDSNLFIRQNPQITSPMGGRRIWDNAYAHQVVPFYQHTLAAIDEFQPDVIVSHFLCIGSRWAAQQAGVKQAILHLSPASLMSLNEPPLVSHFALPQPLRMLQIRLLRALVPLHMNRDLKRFAKQQGQKISAHSLLEMDQQADLLIGMWTEGLRASAQGDPAHLRLAGFPLAAGSLANMPLNEASKEFLLQNPAPVVAAFGSSVRNLGLNLYRQVVQACRSLDRPCVLIGCNDASFDRGYDKLLTPTYETYAALFPYASVIVHHAGIGTCAEALASGKPSVMVPFFADQYDNAYLAEQAHLGSRIPLPLLTSKRLQRTIEHVSHDPVITQQTGRFSEHLMHNEDGAQKAANLIEQLCPKTPLNHHLPSQTSRSNLSL